MHDPERYQQPETDEYPRLGRLLIGLGVVIVVVGLATLAAVQFMGE
jgi:hypothetical protein